MIERPELPDGFFYFDEKMPLPGWYWLILRSEYWSASKMELITVPGKVIFPDRKRTPRVRVCNDLNCRKALTNPRSRSSRVIAWGHKIEEPPHLAKKLYYLRSVSLSTSEV